MQINWSLSCESKGLDSRLDVLTSPDPAMRPSGLLSQVGAASTLIGAMVLLMSLTYLTNNSDKDVQLADRPGRVLPPRACVDCVSKSERPSLLNQVLHRREVG